MHEPSIYAYQYILDSALVPKPEAIAIEQLRAGRFILATNVTSVFHVDSSANDTPRRVCATSAIADVKQIANLTDERRRILQFRSAPC